MHCVHGSGLTALGDNEQTAKSETDFPGAIVPAFASIAHCVGRTEAATCRNIANRLTRFDSLYPKQRRYKRPKFRQLYGLLGPAYKSVRKTG